jgi:uncharacterized protein YegJ (DUF2314 family)
MKTSIFVLILVTIVVVLFFVRRPTADKVVLVPADDPEMQAAIEKARQTLPEFIKAFQTQDKKERHFLVKAPFEENGIVEHMWVADLTIRRDSFDGVLADEPESIKGKKFKQPVTVKQDLISDWMIVEDGTAKGAYTIKVLRNRMSPKERADLDRTPPFKFE